MHRVGKQRSLYILLRLGLFIYIMQRALHVPLVYDEVAIYVRYVHRLE